LSRTDKWRRPISIYFPRYVSFLIQHFQKHRQHNNTKNAIHGNAIGQIPHTKKKPTRSILCRYIQTIDVNLFYVSMEGRIKKQKKSKETTRCFSARVLCTRSTGLRQGRQLSAFLTPYCVGTFTLISTLLLYSEGLYNITSGAKILSVCCTIFSRYIRCLFYIIHPLG